MKRLHNLFSKPAAAAMLIVLIGMGHNVQAAESAFVMSAVENEAAGDEILAGDYAAAVTNLMGNARLIGDGFSKATNLCVSLTLGGQIDDAERQCSRALRYSRAHRRSLDGGAQAKRFHAVALSNRGVLRAVSGDLDGAERDFERAAKISASIENAELNLEHLSALRQRLAANTPAK
ncbi:MAG: hypothetical protein AAF004_03405 [Pseudomonadota bacterium]